MHRNNLEYNGMNLNDTTNNDPIQFWSLQPARRVIVSFLSHSGVILTITQVHSIPFVWACLQEQRVTLASGLP